MPSFRTGQVMEMLLERPGLQRVGVRFDDTGPGDGTDPCERAFVLTDLTGPVAVGDRVVCNTTAVELGLGTGGWHVVHWNLERDSYRQPGPDHVMKLRYTSLQFDAGTSELVHPDLPGALDGTPVVVCLVHSQVGVVAATLRHLAPGRRIAYVMTDGAALPLVLSDLVWSLRSSGVIDSTVTSGHAFGGELEAVTTPSALLLARHVQLADLIVVGMGPGVVGTGTQYGSTAVDAAAALDAVRHLGGQPVLCVRASDGDARRRHQGISHHTTTVAAMTTSGPAVACVPAGAADLPGVEVIEVEPPDVAAALLAAEISVTTMGRTIDDDPQFFAAAGAAAAVAVRLLV